MALVVTCRSAARLGGRREPFLFLLGEGAAQVVQRPELAGEGDDLERLRSALASALADQGRQGQPGGTADGTLRVAVADHRKQTRFRDCQDEHVAQRRGSRPSGGGADDLIAQVEQRLAVALDGAQVVQLRDPFERYGDVHPLVVFATGGPEEDDDHPQGEGDERSEDHPDRVDVDEVEERFE